MKIICITHWRIPSEKTMAPYMMRVAEAFADEGAEVEFWAPRRRNELRRVEPFAYHAIKQNFKLRKLPVIDVMDIFPGPIGFLLMLGSFTVVLFFRVLFMRGRSKTVFYFFDLRDAWTTLLVSRNAFSEIHMYYRSGVDAVNRWGFSRTRGIIAATKPLRAQIEAEYGVPDKKILHAPCGVSYELFGIDTPQEEARTALGLPLNERIILYVGHLFPVKGVDVLFDVYPHLQKGEQIYFLGGTDDDIERFHSKWKAAGEPHGIVIAGRKPHQDIPLWLRAADILVIPNTAKEAAGSMESSPSKLIEYMASSVPIIASDVPGIRDVLDDTMGYFFEPDNPKAIADAIRVVFANGAEAQKRTLAARTGARGLGWNARARKIMDFITRLSH